MTLPASGNISILDLCTEFGATAPKSLTDFYKGGTWVPNIAANAAVPTSGSISLTNFYSARRLDVTPTAIDWINVSGATLLLTTSTQTIAGIDSSIILRIDYSSDSGSGIVRYKINAAAYIDLITGDTFSISVGDTLTFRTVRGASSDNVYVTVVNTSDSNTTLDSFIGIHL